MISDYSGSFQSKLPMGGYFNLVSISDWIFLPQILTSVTQTREVAKRNAQITKVVITVPVMLDTDLGMTIILAKVKNELYFTEL